MNYKIKITFNKNHEMIWTCGGKTIEEVQALAKTIKIKYPEAQVTIVEKK